jgi:hypothetical protein
MSTNDDISANDIPDILAGTTGTEAAAFQNDQAAVLAALQQDPNLLAEVLQPGFVEVVNELAGDAPPTLGGVETVSQSYQDANHETMGDAYNDLLAQNQSETDLNPQPLPPSPVEELQQIEQQLEALEAEISPQPTQEFSSFDPGAEMSPFETAQAEPSYQEENPGGFSEFET